MPLKCCVPECESNYKSSGGVYVSVYKLPSDENERKKWISAIPRANIVITKYTQQFVDDTGLMTLNLAFIMGNYELFIRHQFFQIFHLVVFLQFHRNLERHCIRPVVREMLYLMKLINLFSKIY